MKGNTTASALFLVLLLRSAFGVPALGDDAAPRVWRFARSDIAIRADFDGAGAAGATAVDADTIEVVIRPENAPINNSAWYAFQVAAERPRRITLRLAYENGNHRYHPKLSRDGLKWRPAEDAEYFPPGFVHRWLDRLDARLPDYRVRRQAVSGTGRPLAQRWGYGELGIASVTYEFGDGTDRDLICTTARAAAEEAMALLLAAATQSVQPAGAGAGR